MRTEVNSTADRDEFVAELLDRLRTASDDMFVPHPKRDRMEPLPTPPPAYYRLSEEQRRELAELQDQPKWAVREYVHAGWVVRVGPHQENGIYGYRIAALELPSFPPAPAPLPPLPPPTSTTLLLPRLVMIALPVGLVVVAAALVFGGGRAASSKSKVPATLPSAKADDFARILEEFKQLADQLTQLHRAISEGKKREDAGQMTELEQLRAQLDSANTETSKHIVAAEVLRSEVSKLKQQLAVKEERSATLRKVEMYDAMVRAVDDAKKQKDWITEFQLVGTWSNSGGRYVHSLGTFSVKDGFTTTSK